MSIAIFEPITGRKIEARAIVRVTNSQKRFPKISGENSRYSRKSPEKSPKKAFGSFERRTPFYCWRN